MQSAISLRFLPVIQVYKQTTVQEVPLQSIHAVTMEITTEGVQQCSHPASVSSLFHLLHSITNGVPLKSIQLHYMLKSPRVTAHQHLCSSGERNGTQRRTK